jgi:hypothetical protein
MNSLKAPSSNLSYAIILTFKGRWPLVYVKSNTNQEANYTGNIMSFECVLRLSDPGQHLIILGIMFPLDVGSRLWLKVGSSQSKLPLLHNNTRLQNFPFECTDQATSQNFTRVAFPLERINGLFIILLHSTT